MLSNLAKIGKCYSGVLIKPKPHRSEHHLTVPSHLALVTQAAVRVIFDNPKLTSKIRGQILKDRRIAVDTAFKNGMTLTTFHGKLNQASFGLHLSHRFEQARQITTANGEKVFGVRLEGTPEGKRFKAFLDSEKEAFEEAKSLIFGLGSPIGRRIFFAINGVETSGTDHLDKELYSALLARIALHYKDHFLSEITAIKIDPSAVKAESFSSQDNHRGYKVSVSLGVLRNETDRYIPSPFALNQSNIPKLVDATSSAGLIGNN
jgi:hypothetical protein